MSNYRRLALLGLPPADRHLLEPLLLGSAAEAGYVIVHDLEEADLIISNADDGHVVRGLQARQLAAPVLLIGDSDAGTGWPLLSRPIESGALVAAVSTLAAGAGMNRSGSGLPPAHAPRSPAPWRPDAAESQPPVEADFPSTRVVPLSARADVPLPARRVERLQPQAPVAAPETRPGFQATVPFSDSGRASLAQVAAPASESASAPGFQSTVPFAALEMAGGAPPIEKPVRAPVARPAVAGNGVNALAQDVLMWRDGPTATAAPAPASASAPAPAPAPSRNESDSYWTSSLAPETLDHPTAPQALDGEPSASIMLVGGPRLANGSLIKALRGFGHRVDYAPDGGGALSRLTARDYDVVFLDQTALGVSTLSLCRALLKRAAQERLTLRVVVIATTGSWLQRLLARMAGVDTWMVKPLVKKRLKNYLRKVKTGQTAGVT
ncbi:MAG: hypothetical protein IAE92_07250 [Burkholderiaceae bacterium]|nr:hypothetical protein [Burkholderiaceae bacterium]